MNYKVDGYFEKTEHIKGLNKLRDLEIQEVYQKYTCIAEKSYKELKEINLSLAKRLENIFLKKEKGRCKECGCKDIYQYYTPGDLFNLQITENYIVFEGITFKNPSDYTEEAYTIYTFKNKEALKEFLAKNES